ncbi:MAG: NAD(P) transhydrogenase N-domain of subunit alpha (EC [uncultured Caballeronia sp.]|nr:MAG: NAD(P) transhydrogenase N-domain of subunit alpha (EC [uncultured Caballeronia sp.]
MPPSWLARQAAHVHERAKAADIVISTALIPGRPAPTLISVETGQAHEAGLRDRRSRRRTRTRVRKQERRQLPAHRSRSGGDEARRAYRPTRTSLRW